MISIGDSLILEPRYSYHDEKYKCMVVEMESGCVFIDYPVNVETGKVAFLTDGTELKAVFTDTDQVSYLFDCEILGRVKARIPMIQMSCPPKSAFIKIQRREFVRLEVAIDAAIHPEDYEFLPFKTITDDISAGGLAIRVPKSMHFHGTSYITTWLALALTSGGMQYLRLRGRIIRIEEDVRGANLLSVQFLDMSEGDTQILMRYIFERQLEMKKRGLE